MNNSVIHPQPRRAGTRGVENPGAPSTPCALRDQSLTRDFAPSSTIHTPYYDYFRYFQMKNIRRRTSNCAYPS